MKRTKIVCTIGPASESKSKLTKMVKSGLNVARLNFSHGSYDNHAVLVKNIRAVSEKLKTPVGILQDLQGPRIRIGKVAESGIKLKKGKKIILVHESTKINKKDESTIIPIQYAGLYKDVKKGDTILIDDAKIELKILGIKNKRIECQVVISNLLTSNRGMNFPDSEITTPPITAKDKEDLKFGVKQGVDFISLSFVKEAADIIALRKMIATAESRLKHKDQSFKKIKSATPGPATRTKIIAKIERPEAVANFDKILAVVDGIMIARGDLGLEIPLEDLPLIQKSIITRCIQVSKPVIVATQMLDSMIRFPVPTRAEVSDVANAILDGTDAIMLSGETATGKYPLRAVRVMTRIANQVESKEIEKYEKIEDTLKKMKGFTATISFAVQNIADDLDAKLIACATITGSTARSTAKYRSSIPIVALATSEKSRNQLCLSWGVEPYYLPYSKTFNQLIISIKRLLLQKKLVQKGDTIVIAASHPIGYLGQTNLVKVEII
ncbi:MAG: pyruvate kinase [Parcubacteria group bacterium]|nr:pyruvate kinase [Parcubacteria group bacterium]|tara:strand:- start:1174 stop:2661 length:1488 start_codon:yes stop_codon:yes gene_type:complete